MASVFLRRRVPRKGSRRLVVARRGASARHRRPAVIGPRDVVTQRVSRRARQFPEVELVALDRSGLRERDAALASAIDHAVARRWLTLVALIRPALSRHCPEPALP